jgi:nucleotide-binding universal stress UspA family protein
MFSEILVPLDGSSLAECVLPHVVAVATSFDAVAVLLRVLGQEHAEGSGSPADPVGWHLAEAAAQSYLQEVADGLAGSEVSAETVILQGAPAERVLELARERGFGLIVLSSHGQSGLSGWNVSSVVQKIILRARQSVMIVRAYQPGIERGGVARYRRILVPLDGSQRAECALPVAALLAEANRGTILLTHVVHEPEMPRQTKPTEEDLDLAERLVERNTVEAKAYLDRLRRRLSADAQARLLVGGDVATTLQDAVESEEADLVVLSAHGYSGAPRRTYGSITAGFIAYGTTPLLIVQDIEEDESRPSQAELSVREHKGH